MTTTQGIGKKKRLTNIFRQKNNTRSLIVPVDDLLISGITNQFVDYKTKIKHLESSPFDAIIGYPGFFKQFYKNLQNKSWIVNLTTSTTFGNHTKKDLTIDINQALRLNADAVAVHVNVSSPNESLMLENLARVSNLCETYGLPLLAIVYVRTIDKHGNDYNYLDVKSNSPEKYTEMISHACRIAVELGADIIKTNYTGSIKTFTNVIDSVGDVPILIAGGEKVSEDNAIIMAQDALKAGASGICFGRNTFGRNNIPSFLNTLNELIIN